MDNKSSLSERDIITKYILPAIEQSGWNKQTQIREEVTFTAGRIFVKGKKTKRGEKKRADIIIYYKPNIPVAVVEAKDNTHTIGAGMQQALEYAGTLDIPVAISSNGDGFVIQYRKNCGPQDADGKSIVSENADIDHFPTPAELWECYKRYNNLETKEAEETSLCSYFFDAEGRAPRYYQRIAINRTVEAIARGQNRILLVMATGTGKTYTAFQIIYRLWKAGCKKRILYLADRNNLITQTKKGDFKHFKDKCHIIKHKHIDKSYEIYLALYQGLTNYDEETDAYKQFSKDFFDLIIVDECHRGSAKADSRWRKILEYFNGATQIGMTATPKETKYVSNIDYFGEPVYSYSLKQGIEDGFLAPFKVINVHTNIDDGWRPRKGQKDIHGNEIEDREYNLSDYDYNIIIQDRIDEVAAEITKYLKETDRMSKTIVFCPTEDAADRMRVALNNLNTDMILKDNQGNVKEQYVVRITGSDKYGKDKLDYFISVSQPYPVIATTSKLLSTGSDCKMVKLIVIDELINSMTEFKQIIGRGTRLRYDDGKTHFTIMDFRRVSRLFADPDWDGEIEQNEDFDPKPEPKIPPEPKDPTDDSDDDGDGPDNVDPPTPNPKPIIGKGQIRVDVLQRLVSIYDTDGKLLKQESIEDYTKESILGTYQTLENFIQTWNGERKKEIIRNMLKEKGIDLELIKKDQNMTDVDDFDFICHIAFNQKPLTRRERAENVKKRDIFGKYGEAAREVINALLDKYAELGIYDIESTEILKQNPFTKYGKPARIAALFGGNDKYRAALRELENELYKVA